MSKSASGEDKVVDLFSTDGIDLDDDLFALTGGSSAAGNDASVAGAGAGDLSSIEQYISNAQSGSAGGGGGCGVSASGYRSVASIASGCEPTTSSQ